MEASGHNLKERLHISKKAHLILPTHRILDAAWALMQTHHLHGVPVVDRAQRVIGVLTLENFLRHVEADGVGRSRRRMLSPMRWPPSASTSRKWPDRS
jgi:CBS-domain-containing membrane protein